MAVWGWIIAFSAATLVATYMLFVEAPPPRRLVIASGGKQGAYFHFAQKYADDLRKDKITVEVRETAGTVENLRLLRQPDSGVSLAIIQSGVAHPEDLDQLEALGSLYHEPLWVFYRADKPIERLHELAGKRIGVGPHDSGTFAVAQRLLSANGMTEGASSGGKQVATLVTDPVATSARALREGKLDAAFFVAAFEADYIQSLLNDPSVKLLSFRQQDAYHRRFPFLAPRVLPAGIVNLGDNLPSNDVALLAPTAMLVARKDLHPALVSLLLTTATHIHGKGDMLSDPGEFPSESFCDFPISEDARRYFKNGQPVLQRLLPFWLASLVDRAKVMLIPLVMLLMPLVRAAPPLMRWRTRRKIYLWYSDLRDIDQNLVHGLSSAELDHELVRLRDIEQQVAHVDVPLSYMEEFYHLRLHLGMLKTRLIELKTHEQA